MNRRKFVNNDTYLPVTAQQFQDLTNEILTEVNVVASPHFLDGEYLAQILMSTIHAMDHKNGYVKKSDLFDSCINRISCHLTYNVVQEIQAKLKTKKSEEGTTPGLVEAPPAVEILPEAQEIG